MTNEELAVRIRGGQRELLLDLWEQVRRMALKEAGRRTAYRSNGAELDDLEQAGFIALMRAADSFDPAAGCRFSTWYYPILRYELQWAAGSRTQKQRRDPLNAAVSLDAPVDGGDGDEDGAGTVLSGALSDPAAETAFQEAERREDLRRLRPLLREAVDALPRCQRGAVLARYWGGEPVPNQTQHLYFALKSLRRAGTMQRLEPFR